MNKQKVVLLDSHAIIHRAYHALPEFVSSKGEPTGGIYGLCSMLLKIITDLKPDYIIAAYDLPQPTYRHHAFEGYKATRVKTDKSLIAQIKRSRDVFTAFNIPIYDCPGFEADDILGTVVETLHATRSTLQVIIASGDMDTLQLIDDKHVQVYTLKKGISDTILYDEERVNERFGFGPKLIPDYKGLSGDPSDNISGVPGIGDKTATTLIITVGSVEAIYKKLKKEPGAFAKAGIKERVAKLLTEHEEEALFSKELATIRRDAPIHFALPSNRWSESTELSKILALFTELEFRTLGLRAQDVLEKSRDGKTSKNAGTAEKTNSAVVPEEESAPEDEKELLVAVSLLNSTITDPEREDILRVGQASSFGEAREYIKKELTKNGLTRVFEEIEKPLIPVLLDMEQRGILVDVAYLKKLSVDYHKQLSALEQEIWRKAGGEFNINSPKQLGEVIFNKLRLKGVRQKKTSTGALSTRESELEKLSEAHPIIPDILAHRELQKLLSTYIDTIPTLVAPDGRLHTHFLQNGAATGRMASRDPNLQNIPHKSELGRAVRQTFVAEKGFKLVTFDYSQIELRIAAFLSGDEKLIQIFKEGKDVHTAVAAEVFGIAPEKVDYEMRRRAKVINFGILYGMGVTALQKQLGTDRKEAQQFYNNYFEQFPTLATYLENTKKEAEEKGYTLTFFGRRRYFEAFKSKLLYVRASAERQASNAPIQGTEADIIKLAMVRIAEHLKKEKAGDDIRMLLQVHDELVFEMKEQLVKEHVPHIKKIMETVIDVKDTKGIVCTADASVGNNWAELEKLASDNERRKN